VKFEKEKLRDMADECTGAMNFVHRENVSSGHREQRAWLFVFEHEGSLYEFCIPFDEYEGWHWHDVDEMHECGEVEAHETVTVEYRAVK
jgi:hypothetical protein